LPISTLFWIAVATSFAAAVLLAVFVKPMKRMMGAVR
jgi:hypothetical protein